MLTVALCSPQWTTLPPITSVALFEDANNEFSEKIAFESDDVRMLRLVTQKFLNGRGTIDDIVNVAEG